VPLTNPSHLTHHITSSLRQTTLVLSSALLQTWPSDTTPGASQSAHLGREIMSGPEIKQRRGVHTSTMDAPTTRPAAEARTVTWYEISEWQQDNKYILSGYRPENADYREIFTSLTFLHNETCNVYTHLVGAVLLPLIATAFMRVLSEPHFLNVSETDYVMFGIFFWCAECCLIFSAAYHLIGPHSHAVEQFWHRMDLLGIVIVTVGTFIPGIYYIFTCEPSLQKLHWAIVSYSERPLLPATGSSLIS
jgi:Haemolysin-III related